MPRSADNLPELDAVQTILSTLSSLDDAVRSKVLRTVSAFFSDGASIESTSTLTPPTQSSPSRAFFAERSMSPKDFMLEKEPQSLIERVACLAYFLAHNKGQQTFKTADIIKINTEAALPRIGNPADTIANATKAGLLVNAARGEKQLSGRGERYIEALPDRIAARSELERGMKHRRPAAKRKK